MSSSVTSEVFLDCGPIAQWIEHPPSKRMVAGSNPARSEMHASFPLGFAAFLSCKKLLTRVRIQKDLCVFGGLYGYAVCSRSDCSEPRGFCCFWRLKREIRCPFRSGF
ncbi:hypothetical protein TC_0026 [Chlamydia muridarum str. Nigg]|uniref:Uncharacterized protein n=1 Tax=Chlamydia muridarum (strain MoPn / Nigg) TaxID=243161 RepID=Q9PLR9_CHLMU|nr:hypothetical protein TC_0026 [Chlamydia muridarum str. Nigg]